MFFLSDVKGQVEACGNYQWLVGRSSHDEWTEQLELSFPLLMAAILKKGLCFGGKLWVMLMFYRKCVCSGALSAVPSVYNPALQNTLACNHEWANLAMLQ